jgi:hypothetical protein
MKILKLYLDTSILNFALSDRTGEEILKASTIILLDKIKLNAYEGYISEQVMAEINRSPEPKKKRLIELVISLDLESLTINSEVELLADRYVKEGLIPVKYQEDAIHIALATIHDLDVIVSWNFEHMIKLKTKRGVVAVNELMGYKPIEIITPQEVE